MYIFGILLICCILVYNFKSVALCQDFNFDKIYVLFGINSFSPKIMVV